MSSVRVLVGTKKGAFVLSSDGDRRQWEVAGPHFGGWEIYHVKLPQENCYVNVLRDAMAVDTCDPCGVYFGTTGGQVYASADSGDHWDAIVRDLPTVLSVEVQTLT